MSETGTLRQAIDALTGKNASPPSALGTPSLWDQLIAGDLATVTRLGSTGSALGSRPPVSAELLSLVDEIQRACFAELRHARVLSRWVSAPNGTRYRDIPYELEVIATRLSDSDPLAMPGWATVIARWVGEANRVLGLVAPRITLPRAARCLDCEARDAWVRNEDGEQVRTPALRLLWHHDMVAAIWCAVCGKSRSPADLHLIALQLASER